MPYNLDANHTEIVLPDERPLGWNSFYSGMHWSQRRAEVDRVRTIVRAALNSDETPVEGRVAITIIVYFKNKPLDPDNINAKLYIDALKGWLIEDDTREQIRAVTTISEIDRHNPRVEIVLNREDL